MTSIAIIGRGLSGKLAALYIARHIPSAEITIIDPEKSGLPIVGESTVEVTVQFFKSLGLGTHLEEDHLHKYGLTYYFRLPKSAGGETPEYIQHEAPGVIRLPSYNINRTTFDAELEDRIAPLVTSISGRVSTVHLADSIGEKQTLEIKTNEGIERRITVDHVIDCSGRGRMLTKHFNLTKAPPYQRSSYWFRLEGGDRRILNELNIEKLKHHCFESYYVTHHFYGKGYWIWIIPMRSESGRDLVSFGITYRPDVIGEEQMDFERLCTIFRRDHPKLEDLIRSGNVIDESRYYNYMYEATHYYDRDGRWFLLGDSGFTFDPANSAGIAYLGHQIPQIASIILKKEMTKLTPCYVEALEGHLKAQLALQDQWSNWYLIMDDPIKMAWTLILANMGYFHLVVPNFMSGAFLNAGVARQVSKLLPRYSPGLQPKVYPFPSLLNALAQTNEPKEIIRRAPALYESTIPFSFFRPDNISRGRLISRYFYKRAALRIKALSLLGGVGKPKYWPLVAVHTVLAGIDILRSIFIGLFPWLYEREVSKCPKSQSPFAPQHAFLFPNRRDVGQGSKMLARLRQGTVKAAR